MTIFQADELFNNRKDYRNIAIYLLKRHTAMTNRRAGKLFGDLSYSAVAKAQQRFSAKLDKDRSLRKIINKITTKCPMSRPDLISQIWL